MVISTISISTNPLEYHTETLQVVRQAAQHAQTMENVHGESTGMTIRMKMAILMIVMQHATTKDVDVTDAVKTAHRPLEKQHAICVSITTVMSVQIMNQELALCVMVQELSIL
jgi:hypothetical protein